MVKTTNVSFCLFLFFGLLVGCMSNSTVGVVEPFPNVTSVGNGTYSIDTARVSDRIVVDGRITLEDVQRSLALGFSNAVGSGYRENGAGDVRLIFERFSVSLDKGAFGILRITYRAVWKSIDGTVLANASGTALPKNPMQTGDGHWRDVIEVMFEQMVRALDEAQERIERSRENRDQSTRLD